MQSKLTGKFVKESLTNSFRLNELIQGDGIAIIDAGLNFGGGILGRYGINSNTSGQGFLKCAIKKIKKAEKEKQGLHFESAPDGSGAPGTKVKGEKKKSGKTTSHLTTPAPPSQPKRLEGVLTNPYA